MRASSRLISGSGALFVALGSFAVGSATASVTTVCPSGCAFTQISAAVAAASSSATITVGPGAYQGGFRIAKNLKIVGAGAGSTVISGGGPVITIGTPNSPSEPTVNISGVTIRGGMTTSNDFDPGFENVEAYGGGILIEPAAKFAAKAQVTISDSVITANAAAPTQIYTNPDIPNWPVCPGPSLCPYALAGGGGIASLGDLTLIRTTVSNNSAQGSVTSDADGGGIWAFGGALNVLSNSSITGNYATASAPNGRFAEGGGIFTLFKNNVTISDSSITDNTASLSSDLPFFYDPAHKDADHTIELGVNSGGVHMGEGGSLSVTNTHVDGNHIVANVPNGEPEVFDAGMCACSTTDKSGSPLSMSNSTVNNNTVDATMASTADVFAFNSFSAGGALEFDTRANVVSSQVMNNSTTVTAVNGDAIAGGAVAVFFTGGWASAALVRDSVVAGNTVVANSTTGMAKIFGVGVQNSGFLDLRNDRIVNNAGTANGVGGLAQGGGIWNGPFPGLDAAQVQLSVKSSTVTGNVLGGSGSPTPQGGGIFTAVPMTLTGTQVANNLPNNCTGIAC